jgi:hypothetical protein
LRARQINSRHSGTRHPNSGLPEFGNMIVEVGNSRLGCASPESITPVFEFSIYTPTQGVWIPDSRFAASGMTSAVPREFPAL